MKKGRLTLYGRTYNTFVFENSESGIITEDSLVYKQINEFLSKNPQYGVIGHESKSFGIIKCYHLTKISDCGEETN